MKTIAYLRHVLIVAALALHVQQVLLHIESQGRIGAQAAAWLPACG